MQNKDQTYLNYAGRLIYNYRCYYSTNSEYRKNHDGVSVKTTGTKTLRMANSSEHIVFLESVTMIYMVQ